ncbi:MAG TPA: ABC transporter ATP-binding protein [Pseudonocardia sp.]|uniref:ABC transporter ATP-binding protein n=1 Tax=Pseudonocardia sp. TaxID=60912 RepID=UPI002B93DEB8|nr:ABC transporter ATP-binding protein [Pseudonocardia sp.]HTF52106.1 ABC transporter ATP-binding protein [Pseudonocardia sp.]
MNHVVELRGVGHNFGAGPVLADLDLAVDRGEFLALLGPSGCGKSTTLRVIAGYLRPAEGQVLIGGRDATRVPPQRRNIGMVFQSYALFPHLSVAENVAFGLRMRKVGKLERTRRVGEALELVGLGQLAARKPGQLSGGQQQRVALARAVVIRPDVLLLDEPLSNLDARLRIQLRSELARVQRETGLTAVLVTHDQEEALALADRMAVLRDGRIAQQGSPREVFERPRNRFVAQFLGYENVLALPDRGEVAVRPEHVRIEAADAAADPSAVSFEGVVDELTYRGTHTTATVTVPLPAGPVALRGIALSPGALAPGRAARVVLSEPAIVPLLDEPHRPVLEENPV